MSQKQQTTRERLQQFMKERYSSIADADSFVRFAEGVLEFALLELKRTEPSARFEIDSIETTLAYIGDMLDAEEALKEVLGEER
ncbi:MAG: hypothetical protein AAB875_02255 [Patescibacteria group bacterium]